MREAIGTTYVVNFIIVFFVIFIAFFVGSMTYTKAFKVKNKIIDTIEYYNGDIENSGRLNSSFQSEVDSKLGEIGYRISNNNNCKNDNRFSESGGSVVAKSSSTYRYCIYQFNSNKGKYYGVVAYMYFEIPIIGTKLEFPVYGQTKTFIEL